jgi:hypothetical protein
MGTIKERLTGFIKQYYLNRILRGAIFLGISFIVLLLVFSGIEFFGWFNSGTRAFLFYFYLAFNAVLLWVYLLVPLGRLTGIARGISLEYAARIIGTHFPQIEDKLLNLLQLQELGARSGVDDGVSGNLLLGAIRQKEELLKPFPFVKAVEFQGTVKYLRYLVPTVVVLVILMSFKPELIRDPVYRIRNYQVQFEKPAPFTFVILNDQLTGVARENYRIRFTTEGDEIPADAFVDINGINYKANQIEKNVFEYEVQNLQSDVRFKMNAINIWSKEYIIGVIPRPAVRNFRVHLDYPPYTRKPSEVIENVGDLIVPRGTRVTWRFNTNHADDLQLVIGDNRMDLTRDGSRFSYSQRVMQEMTYAVKPINRYIDTLSPVQYTLEVIPDEYPAIKVNEVYDTLNHFFVFFSGEIADDYGFTRLTYHTARVRNGDTLLKKVLPLPYPASGQKHQFMHYEDLSDEGYLPGDQLVWFFEVWDNDQVSGPKPTRTFVSVYRIPGHAELEEMQDQLEQAIKDEMDEAVKTARAIRQEARELQNELRFKEQLNWQDREKINQLINKQEQLKSKIEDLQRKMEHKYQKENLFKDLDPEILEKQKQLQELMDKLLDDDTRKLLEEIQKMLEELNKDKIGEMLEKIQMSNEELNLELERNLELFKQLELEKDLQESIDALNQLAEEQKKLAEESAQPNADPKQIAEQQKELNEEFKRISEKLKKIEETNKELEFPNNLQNTNAEQQEINSEMRESMNQLQRGQPSNASPRQQNASDKMQELSDKLSDMMDDMMAEQLAEDIMTLRQILKNLVHISFEQEELMKTAQATSRIDPRYPEIINKQNQLKRDFQIIEDSLVALGKRQMAIQGIVSREISAIKDNMEQSVTRFLDVHTVGIRNTAGREQGIERQQFAMTSMNNLALLLAESLNNMRDQQNQQSGEGRQCKNPRPGPGKPSLQQIRQRQQGLNQQLQQMRDQMQQQGQQPNGRQNSMSEQFARMAAEQEALRRALSQYMDELRQQGFKDMGEMSDIMQEMEKTEAELVNKILNNNTMLRQEQINTRLLESEKAEMEREQEERRESREAKNQLFSNPLLFLEYNKLKEREQEMLRYSTPLLQPFYKSKVNDYLIKQEAER